MLFIEKKEEKRNIWKKSGNYFNKMAALRVEDLQLESIYPICKPEL